MVRRSVFAAVAAALVLSGVVRAAEKAELGKPVSDFKLTDVMTGKEVSLSEFKGKVVVLNFISYKCPVSVAYDNRLAKFTGEYKSKDVVFLHIDSCAGNKADDIKKAAEGANLGAAVLHDNGNVVADYYSAQTTPHLYVIDKSGNLVYKGSFDDGKGKGWTTVTKNYVADAVEALLAGKEVPVKETKSFGCGIRRVK